VLPFSLLTGSAGGIIPGLLIMIGILFVGEMTAVDVMGSGDFKGEAGEEPLKTLVFDGEIGNGSSLLVSI
jgi:hypothetical protein